MNDDRAENWVGSPNSLDIETTDSQGSPSPSPTFLSSALHGTLGYFSEGMPLAYLLATVITGLGLLVGSLIHVSQPEQIARTSVPSVVAEPKAVMWGGSPDGRLQVDLAILVFPWGRSLIWLLV